jgi:hypothetical protein
MRHAGATIGAFALLFAASGLLAAADEPARKEQPAGRAGPGTASAPAHRTGPRWEYRTLTRQELLDLGQKDVTAGLNKLGDDGWELVAVRAGMAPERGPRRPGDTGTEYYFKRAVAASAAPTAEAPSAGPSGEGQFVVYRLRHASAAMLAKVLDELMNGKGGGGGSQRARIVADPATNQLLIRARDNDLATVEALVNKLDVPAENERSDTAPGPGPRTKPSKP